MALGKTPQPGGGYSSTVRVVFRAQMHRIGRIHVRRMRRGGIRVVRWDDINAQRSTIAVINRRKGQPLVSILSMFCASTKARRANANNEGFCAFQKPPNPTEDLEFVRQDRPSCYFVLCPFKSAWWTSISQNLVRPGDSRAKMTEKPLPCM